MDTVTIRQSIEKARHHEAGTGELRYLLRLRLPGLPAGITPDGPAPVTVLVNFVERYAMHVPEFLEAMQAIAAQTGTEEPADAVAETVEKVFCRPPALLDGHRGLSASMIQSYLAHRLTEEMNDRAVRQLGSWLLPMDMTRSNLIVHCLIGEPFANQLDEAVFLMAGDLAENSCLEHVRLKQPRWSLSQWGDYLERWPCLVDHLAEELLFVGPSRSLH